MAPVFALDKQRRAWSTPPIGGANTPSYVLGSKNDQQVRDFILAAYPAQYSQPSNWNGLYRQFLRLDDTTGARVIDYGSGFGFDALSYALKGNSVALADISMPNLRAAARVLLAMEVLPRELIPIADAWPHFSAGPFDIFHSSGVLHHTPLMREVLQRASSLIDHNGEIRLMLYTDHLWRQATGTEPPPIEDPVWLHDKFTAFVRFCDAVGDYADWYTADKLAYMTEDFLTLHEWHYIREDHGYAVAILKRKA